MRPILIQPHDDDAFLFACFTAIREKPLIVTVFDSYYQPKHGMAGTGATERAAETQAACDILGLENIRLGFRDDEEVGSWHIRDALANAILRSLLDNLRWFLPAYENNGHAQHNQIAHLLEGHIPVTGRYRTYTREPAKKSISANEVAFEPEWVALKLRALACFRSQFQPATGCVEHFIGRSLREYYL